MWQFLLRRQRLVCVSWPSFEGVICYNGARSDVAGRFNLSPEEAFQNGKKSLPFFKRRLAIIATVMRGNGRMAV